MVGFGEEGQGRERSVSPVLHSRGTRKVSSDMAAVASLYESLPEKVRKENDKVLRNRKLDAWAWKSENLFYFLNCTGHYGTCPGITVPPTVFISHGRVVDAFYTNAQGQFGSLESAPAMDMEVVIRFLGQHIKRGSPLCCWRPNYHTDDFETTGFMSEAEARDFLGGGKKMPDGVYQGFIPPVGNRNSYLTAKFYRGTLYIEKCENVFRLTDASTKGTEIVTICGGRGFRCWQSKAVNIGRSSFLGQRIMATCEKVINHIMTVTPQRCDITGLEAVFKQDLSGRLYLCWVNKIDITNSSAEHKEKLLKELMSDVSRNRRNHTKTLGRLKSMLREEPEAFNRRSGKYYKALLPSITIPPSADGLLNGSPKTFKRPGARRRRAEWQLPPLLRKSGADTR